MPSTLVSYLFNIYLRSHGGLQDVGIYQSGFGLIDKYVGLIFVAMSTDYYPRLAAVHTQNTKLSSIMNQQTVVSLLILCPVIAIFLPTAPLIVQLLLTKSFLPVIPFLSWAILGMIFKVTSTCLGYILIVKGAHRLFLGTELLSSIIILSSNIIGYTLAGIKGIGIAFLISYICYFIVVGSICRYKFNIKFNKEVIRLIFFHNDNFNSQFYYNLLWDTNKSMGRIYILQFININKPVFFLLEDYGYILNKTIIFVFMNPQLSIIIPFYGKADKTLLQYCIDSINNQAIPLEKYELIIADGNGKNLGAGAARNNGILQANGEYILFVDADDYLFPNSLLHCLDFLEKEHPDVLSFKFQK